MLTKNISVKLNFNISVTRNFYMKKFKFLLNKQGETNFFSLLQSDVDVKL